MAAMGVKLLQIRRDFWSQLSEQAVTDCSDTSIDQLGVIPARIRERLPEAPGNDWVTVSVDWLPAPTQVALPQLE